MSSNITGTIVTPLTPKESQTIRDLVFNISGIKLSEERDNFIQTRLQRRLRVLGLSSWRDYLSILCQQGSSEVEFFVNALTTNRTEFFRENVHFEYLVKYLTKNKPKKPFTCWIAACSFGQEAYTLAMTLESLKEKLGFFEYRILATDIDTGALRTAERGIYAKEVVERDVPYDHIKKFFLRGKGQNALFYKISPHLKRNIKFRHHNLCAFNEKIPMNFDLIMIRNVLIYFDEMTIKKIQAKLIRHLHPNSHLITGVCETLVKPNLNHLEQEESTIYRYKRAMLKVTQPKEAKAPAPVNKIPSVLVVDDSAVIRKLLGKVIDEDPQFSLFGCANDPIEAEEMMKNHQPDIISLDVHMPRVNGIEYLQQVVPKRSIPVIMLTGLADSDGELSLKAMELGAVDFLSKPDLSEIESFAPLLKDKLLAAVSTRIQQVQSQGKAVQCPVIPEALRTDRIVAIGSSTGGTVALTKILSCLPKESPPIVVVQHIPPHFSNLFAKRLNMACQLDVKEAQSGDSLEPGCVLIAPGDRHMKLLRKEGASGYKIVLKDTAPVNRHKPSVDVLFESVCKVVGKKSIGVILTGMGDDGARGLKEMHDIGAHTIAQDEESCVVFGMPKEAIKLGAATDVVHLNEMTVRLAELLSKPGVKKAS